VNTLINSITNNEMLNLLYGCIVYNNHIYVGENDISNLNFQGSRALGTYKWI